MAFDHLWHLRHFRLLRERALLACSGERPGRTLNILQYTEQLFTTKNSLAQNVITTEIEKPRKHPGIALYLELLRCMMHFSSLRNLHTSCSLPSKADRWIFSKLFARWSTEFLLILDEYLCIPILGSAELPCQPRFLMTHDVCATRKIIFLKNCHYF